MSRDEMPPALKSDIKGHQGQNRAGKIGKLPGDLAESAEPLFRMAQAPGRERARGHQRERQARAEREHHENSQGELLQLKADQNDRKSSRTGQKPAGQSEE